MQPDARANESGTRVVLDEERSKRRLAEAIIATDQSAIFGASMNRPSPVARLVRGLLKWAVTDPVTCDVLSAGREITSIIDKRSSLFFLIHDNTISIRKADIV
jgi:hypothetical protein